MRLPDEIAGYPVVLAGEHKSNNDETLDWVVAGRWNIGVDKDGRDGVFYLHIKKIDALWGMGVLLQDELSVFQHLLKFFEEQRAKEIADEGPNGLSRTSPR